MSCGFVLYPWGGCCDIIALGVDIDYVVTHTCCAPQWGSPAECAQEHNSSSDQVTKTTQPAHLAQKRKRERKKGKEGERKERREGGKEKERGREKRKVKSGWKFD